MASLLTFAIGDVHGCFDKLLALLGACETVAGGKRARVVLIGDYVDRGPDSRKVLEYLIARQQRDGDRFICLLGNHEAMLLDAAHPERTVSDVFNWRANGGETTLESYGVDDERKLPAAHLAWIAALPLHFADGGRLFVHAGIRPGVPLEEQTERDLLWIREPFLSSADDHGVFVVHGHTPLRTALPDLRPNRLNLDTAACFGGELTAALFAGDEARPDLFLNSGGDVWEPDDWPMR
jgi:serine/threonine protein phosphatase 1